MELKNDTMTITVSDKKVTLVMSEGSLSVDVDSTEGNDAFVRALMLYHTFIGAFSKATGRNVLDELSKANDVINKTRMINTLVVYKMVDSLK